MKIGRLLLLNDSMFLKRLKRLSFLVAWVDRKDNRARYVLDFSLKLTGRERE